ncbi:archaeal proteasome endopeptidase complex subunit alpha [Haloarchaeobius iranensis]|uniref:Proteasome subunit alpha n=1 Tax=Haloarchaeobius iranensis TaxID=996166 RepID=A0A1G9TZ65_9EURY|nr:archaeal proteasome endopeptidase complex subunit alpha [Haloarchaeobius iranensis]SDM52908.1 proteasome alpha subunit [Haloarchaeobius iranensis]
MQDGDDRRSYDRGTSIFSPDGRLYQVEYAREAVRKGSATVGVTTEDSVVFASDTSTRSPLLERDSVEKIHDVDGRLGIASAGHVADARRLVDEARRFAQAERLRYGEAPGVETTAKAIAEVVQESTQTGGMRPFGVGLLVGGVVDGAPRLYETDPSGTPSAWRATAIGSGSDEIRDYLETEFTDGLGTDDGIALALDALRTGTDELTPGEAAVATMDADGFRSMDEDVAAGHFRGAS